MEEVCFNDSEERLTAELLQKLSHLSYVIARSTSELPDLPVACPVNVRYKKTATKFSVLFFREEISVHRQLSFSC